MNLTHRHLKDWPHDQLVCGIDFKDSCPACRRDLWPEEFEVPKTIADEQTPSDVDGDDTFGKWRAWED